MEISTTPPDTELEMISEALLPSVLGQIERKRRAQKKIRRSVVGIGAVVLVSGTLAGAALLSPVFNPGHGELYGTNGQLQPASFAISCFATVAHNASQSLTQQYNSQKEFDAASRDFSAACRGITAHASLQDALSQTAENQQKTGLTCGIINVVGGQTNYWQTIATDQRRPAIEFTTEASGIPAVCDASVTITAPIALARPVIVCAIASNWAAVYPRGNDDPSTICMHAGYPEWPN